MVLSLRGKSYERKERARQFPHSRRETPQLLRTVIGRALLLQHIGRDLNHTSDEGIKLLHSGSRLAAQI